MNPSITDSGAYFTTRAGGLATAIAAGTGDNTEKSGSWVSRKGKGSGKLVLTFEATLGQGDTLSLAANARDATADDGTGAADFGDAYDTTVVATGPTGGGTVRGTVELNFNFNMANEFVQAQFTPNLSRAGTDTCTVMATWCLGGAHELPAS